MGSDAFGLLCSNMRALSRCLGVQMSSKEMKKALKKQVNTTAWQRVVRLAAFSHRCATGAGSGAEEAREAAGEGAQEAGEVAEEAGQEEGQRLAGSARGSEPGALLMSTFCCVSGLPSSFAQI